MLTPGSPLALPQGADGDLLRSQIFQADGSSHNVNDGIHRPHLVKMHLLRSGAVNCGLRLRQHAENGQRPLLYLGIQLRFLQHLTDLPVIPGRLRLCGVHLHEKRAGVNAAFLRSSNHQAIALQGQFRNLSFQMFPVRPQIQQGADRHISADAGASFQI